MSSCRHQQEVTLPGSPELIQGIALHDPFDSSNLHLRCLYSHEAHDRFYAHFQSRRIKVEPFFNLHAF